MMKKIILILPILLFASDKNVTIKKDISIKDSNKTVKTKKVNTSLTKKDLLKKHLEEEMKREAKYAKEKTFYMGKDYNLTEHQVDPKSLKHIKAIEPDYDFDMDEGVYSD